MKDIFAKEKSHTLSYFSYFPPKLYFKRQNLCSTSAPLSFGRKEMKYEQRLKAAAEIILASDSRTVDAPVNVADFGVTATLKPYQVEGVSWLIRRYTLGVNVVLGMILAQNFPSLCLIEEKT